MYLTNLHMFACIHRVFKIEDECWDKRLAFWPNWIAAYIGLRVTLLLYDKYHFAIGLQNILSHIRGVSLPSSIFLDLDYLGFGIY